MLWVIVTSAFAGKARPLPASPAICGLLTPAGIVYSAALQRVYVVERERGALEIHEDPHRSVLTARVGAGPVSVAVDAARGKAYVADADDCTVTVVDARSGARLSTIAVGGRPYCLALDAAHGRCFLTFTEGDAVAVIDCASDSFRRLKVGSSDLVTVNQRRGTADLLGYGTALRIVDAAALGSRDLAIGSHAWALAENDASGSTYACLIEDATVVEVDREAKGVRAMRVGAIPCAVAVDRIADRLVVANYGADSVTVLDEKSGAAVATVAVGRRPDAVALDVEGRRILVANRLDATVSVVDAVGLRVVATLPAGRNPCGLVVVAGTHRLYVENDDAGAPSTVIDLQASAAGR